MKLPAFLALATAVGLAAPALAAAYAAFRTPGEAAYCGLSEGEAPAGLICWTPNDGFEIGMGQRGRPSHDYNKLDKGLRQNLARVLRFGTSWADAGFRCVSRSTGLTCVNRVGHGWSLGRYKGYRVF